MKVPMSLKLDPKRDEISPESLLDALGDSIRDKIQTFEKIKNIFATRSEHTKTPELLHIMNNLIMDANRSLSSTIDYKKTIKHLSSDERKELSLITLTSNAMSAVFDKRLLQILIMAKNNGIITDVEENSCATKYFKKFKLSTELHTDHLPSEAFSHLEERLSALGDPYRPHFSQTKAASTFSETENTASASKEILGKEIIAIGDSIGKTPILREIINVGVFFHNGSWVTSNNRSLATASVSGVEPRLTIVFPNQAFIGYYKQKQAALKPKKRSPDETDSLWTIELENKDNKTRGHAPPICIRVPTSWRMAFAPDATSPAPAEKEACGGAGSAPADKTEEERYSPESSTDSTLSEGDVSPRSSFDSRCSSGLSFFTSTSTPPLPADDKLTPPNRVRGA